MSALSIHDQRLYFRKWILTRVSLTFYVSWLVARLFVSSVMQADLFRVRFSGEKSRNSPFHSPGVAKTA
jgi:hypothetical protein